MSNIYSNIHDPNYQRLYDALGPSARYNGLWYYSQTLEKYLVPRVKTDRPWNLIGLKPCGGVDNMIVIVHNNIEPGKEYNWLRKFRNTVCISNIRRAAEEVSQYSYSIYMPPCIDIKEVRSFGKGIKKDQDTCFAGNPWPKYRTEIDKYVPAWVHRFGPMPREEFLPILAHYKNAYAIGVTAAEARALGCNILKRSDEFDPEDFPLIDCKDAAKCIEHALDLVLKQKVNRPIDCTKLPEFKTQK